MSIYVPVVSGETDDLRVATENMLCEYPGVVESQLVDHSDRAAQLGKIVTFGTEIELIFADDPNADYISDANDDELYVEMVKYIQDGQPLSQRRLDKGEVVRPDEHPEPVMPSYDMYDELTCNNDQQDSGIIELRTAPADALEANERYWRTVEAIGEVAARHGKLGLILSTHLSASVFDVTDNNFENFETYPGGLLAATVQHGLEQVRPLQMDAGLEEGFDVQEAFPKSKDAQTDLHTERLELRHPVVGIIDPRVDMLAVTDGVVQLAEGTATESAINRLRACRAVRHDDLYEDNWDIAAADLLSFLVMYDVKAKRLVMPAVMESTSWGAAPADSLRYLARIISGDPSLEDPFEDNGAVIRSFVRDLRTKDDKLFVHPDSPYFQRVSDNLKQGVDIRFRHDAYRVDSNVTYETPTEHARRRGNIRYSSSVRRILGEVADFLTPADRSIEVRQELIDRAMIVAEED